MDGNIIRKPDGKRNSCAFVEYKKVFQATQARKDVNASQLYERTIAVDLVVPKEGYKSNTEAVSKGVKCDKIKDKG